MDQVADIVSLPHLDDSQVQEGVLDARREKNQTVSDLNEFDATQTNRLMPVSDQLQAMEQWIAQLGFSTLEGLPPESLMTAPSAAIGNSTKKPEAKSENGFLNAAKEFADNMLFDDLKTITDKDSSLLQKGIAIFGMTPMGKGVKAGKLGFKLVKETPIGKWFKADTNDVAFKGKRHYTATEVAQIQQRNAIKSVESGKTKLKNNQQKGNYGEMKMDVHYESQGYARISEGRVTKLDQPIAKGIDGVYENSSPPPKYIIAEAKYNSAQLQHTKHHRQMNNDWIDERLEDAIGKIKAEEVAYEKLMNPNNVQSKLIRIKANGEIIEKFLDNRGFIKGD